MGHARVITIGTLGLTKSEQMVLKSICIMTKGRVQGGYAVSEEPEIGNSDVVIVNVDDIDAAIKWRTLAVKPAAPLMVLYTSQPPNDPAQPYLLRPFGPAKLLAVLDGIAARMNESAEVWKKPPVPAATAASADATGVRALVVDDSSTVRAQLELELRNLNIDASVAETGEQGLELLAQNEYDIIFLDVVLPGANGYQLCKEIRANPKTRQTPVIMLTSKSSPFDRVRGSLVGCSAYLTKPVDYGVFREEVGRHLKIAALR